MIFSGKIQNSGESLRGGQACARGIPALIAAQISPIESLGKIAAVWPCGNTAIAEGGSKQNQRLQPSMENGSRQPESSEAVPLDLAMTENLPVKKRKCL